MVKFLADKHYSDDLLYLIVFTTNITDEILDQIDTFNKRVVFSIHCTERTPGDHKLHINVSIDKWNKFVEKITHLRFEGCFTNFEFKAEHMKGFKKLELLSIGATDYPIFLDEDPVSIAEFPIIKKLELTGYGMVEYSKQLNDWIKILKDNNCDFIFYKS